MDHVITVRDRDLYKFTHLKTSSRFYEMQIMRKVCVLLICHNRTTKSADRNQVHKDQILKFDVLLFLNLGLLLLCCNLFGWTQMGWTCPIIKIAMIPSANVLRNSFKIKQPREKQYTKSITPSQSTWCSFAFIVVVETKNCT